MKIRERLKRTDDETLRYMIRYLRKHNVIIDDKDGGFVFIGILNKKQLRLLRECTPL